MAMTTEPRLLRVGLVQMHMSAEPAENLERAIASIRTAAANGARLVCLPELFRSRYFCQSENADYFALAEVVPGPTTRQLVELAVFLGWSGAETSAQSQVVCSATFSPRNLYSQGHPWD